MKTLSFIFAAGFGASLSFVAHLSISMWQFWVVFLMAVGWVACNKFQKT